MSPEMAAYDNEDHLQRIISAAPHQIAGISDSALTVREFQTSAGPADVCIVDRDGSITVVECKLASNSERRRMVIGQVIDYASAICVDGPAAFRNRWARQGGPELSALDDNAAAHLDDCIDNGRVHLCLAVDRIDEDLRRLVEYLNRITRENVRVTALQLAYARHGNLEVLVPSTFGGELATAKARRAETGQAWTLESFVDALASPEDRVLAESFFELQRGTSRTHGDHDDFWFGNRPGGGIFFHPYGLRYAPLMLKIDRDGALFGSGTWNNYPGIRNHAGFAQLAEFVGQDHWASASAFLIADLDADELWQIVLRCAENINAA